MVKQKRDHIAPLSAPARLLLAEIREAQIPDRSGVLPEYVFPGRRGSIKSIKRAWGVIMKAAGISALRIHDLRHSFASELVSSGASLPFIGALLGHSNPNTTARYAHLYDGALRELADRVGARIENAGKEAEPPIKLRG
jgi:integrase